MAKAAKRLFICLDNAGYEVSLERRKIYVALPDARSERAGPALHRRRVTRLHPSRGPARSLRIGVGEGYGGARGTTCARFSADTQPLRPVRVCTMTKLSCREMVSTVSASRSSNRVSPMGTGETRAVAVEVTTTAS